MLLYLPGAGTFLRLSVLIASSVEVILFPGAILFFYMWPWSSLLWLIWLQFSIFEYTTGDNFFLASLDTSSKKVCLPLSGSLYLCHVSMHLSTRPLMGGGIRSIKIKLSCCDDLLAGSPPWPIVECDLFAKFLPTSFVLFSYELFERLDRFVLRVVGKFPNSVLFWIRLIEPPLSDMAPLLPSSTGFSESFLLKKKLFLYTL